MRVLTKLFLAAFTLPLLWSCGDIDNPPIIPQTSSSILSAPSTIVLEEADSASMISFTVSPADFGIALDVVYTLQMDRPGGNFSSPIDLGESETTTIEVRGDELNRRAIAKGIEPGEAGPMEFRVRATTTRALAPLVGATSTVNISTYATAAVFRNLFLVGDATAPGWANNNNNPALFRDPANPDLYVYSGFFAQGAFKVLERLGEWRPQYGTKDGTTIAVNVGDDEPNPIPVAAAGFYTFTMNLSDNSFSLVPFAGPTNVTFSTVGIIGDGTSVGWESGSLAMTASSFDPHLWRITTTLGNGMMKFRADNKWDVNWGASTAISGVGVQNGPDIPVEAGNFTIWFSSLDGRYILIPN
jgi:starch-binding outer membrane protein SusE/F